VPRASRGVGVPPTLARRANVRTGRIITEDWPLTSFEFPKLPILSQAEVPPPPRLSQREKYGGLFYVGIAGLVLLCVMVGWFAYGFWSLRDVWEDVYVLHNPKRSEWDRMQAAFRLSHDPRVNDGQRMEICLRRDVPDLARYLLAEAISTDAVASDPRSFSLAVARSADWPDWLRLLLTRRLAYGAARGYAIPREALNELAGHSDAMIGLWANAALTLLSPETDPQPAAALEQATHVPAPMGELASLLRTAIRLPADQREKTLDQTTVWLRTHDAQAAKIWAGWGEVGGRLVRLGEH
jgi:hypothetical protein